eukprot:3287260-Amphidinium_carterae.1
MSTLSNVGMKDMMYQWHNFGAISKKGLLFCRYILDTAAAYVQWVEGEHALRLRRKTRHPNPQEGHIGGLIQGLSARPWRAHTSGLPRPGPLQHEWLGMNH